MQRTAVSPPRWSIFSHINQVLTMKRVTFITTEKCNLQCDYCFEARRPTCQDMSLDVAFKFVDKAISDISNGKFNLYDFEFFGGEPLLRPNFISQVIDYTESKRRELGLKNGDLPIFTYRVVTNGTLFGNQDVQELMLSNKLHGVFVSLDGLKETHNRHRGNSYDKIVEYLDFYKSTQKIPLALLTLHSSNVHTLYDDVVHIVRDLGIDTVHFNYVADDKNWNKQEYLQALRRQMYKLADFICLPENYSKVWLSLFETIGFLPTSHCVTACHSGWAQITCSPRGKLFTCFRFATIQDRDQYSIGDVDSGIDPVALSKVAVRVEDIKNLEDCLVCNIGKGCKRCTAYYADTYGSPCIGDKLLCGLQQLRFEVTAYLADKRKRIWDSYFY